MKIALLKLFICLCFLTVSVSAEQNTFCNPLNLNYRFSIENLASHRTAADPLIVLYKDDYYLFASKSGGYWFSRDMRDWTFVEPKGLPLEDYAPSVLILNGKMYYTAHRDKLLFETEDPKKGLWTKTADIGEYADPMLFLDDDGRLYMYYGSGLNGGIWAVELDPKRNFKEVSAPVKLMNANSDDHGWEGSGADNLGYVREGVNRVEPYVEGSWMTKHNGVYYLQYSAPGTIWNTYADGVYTSKSPTKDFVYQDYSPFSYKPGGFIGSAGHGGTFQDKQGNYWRVVTMVISVAHKFERRLGIFPAGFDKDGVFRTETYLGDYPQFLPGVAKQPLDNNLTGWLLLSFGKTATASSALDGFPERNAFDEEIRTVWSAKTADKGEFLSVDLGGVSTVSAIQINFGEHDTTAKGRAKNLYQQYLIEVSSDGKKWETLIDKSQNQKDLVHDYIQLEKPRKTRFVRLTNIHTADGQFAVRDFRIFGTTGQGKPGEVKDFTVLRNPADGRKVKVEWPPVKNAEEYMVRFGIKPDKLYSNYQIVKGNSLVLNGLNKGVGYYFTIDAVNGRGVTRGEKVIYAK